MEKTDFVKIAERMSFGKTQGSRKLLAYINHVIQSDDFQVKVKVVREKYGIPPHGYHTGKDNLLNPPKEISEKTRKGINNEIKNLCEKYNLYIVDWEETFQSYIYYNKFVKPYDFTLGHLCHVSDLKEDAEESLTSKIATDENNNFPIAVRVSPYATKRDILDFINKSYPFINWAQEKYRNKNLLIGKLKKRNPKIEKRNNFILHNKHLPLKEIATKLQARFGIGLDEGHIAKIISLEKHRRK